jgi:hypothetical protein
MMTARMKTGCPANVKVFVFVNLLEQFVKSGMFPLQLRGKGPSRPLTPCNRHDKQL